MRAVSFNCEELPRQDVAEDDFCEYGDEEGIERLDISGIREQATKMIIGIRGKTSVPYSCTTEILA